MTIATISTKIYFWLNMQNLWILPAQVMEITYLLSISYVNSSAG